VSKQDDEALAWAFNQGDEKALKAVYDRYFNNLCYFAWRIIGNRAEAEDIVMEALTVLLRRHADFSAMHCITAFLVITVRNRCFRHLDAMKRRRANEQELKTFLYENESYVLAKMERNERIREVYQVIEKLPPMQKAVFSLFYFEELSASEIALELNIPPEAVYNNKRKALNNLRIALFQNRLFPLSM
jgi:RNA polymerase sigma factor (sigma-70 family)